MHQHPSFFSRARIAMAILFLPFLGAPLLFAETQLQTGQIKKIIGPDELHLV